MAVRALLVLTMLVSFQSSLAQHSTAHEQLLLAREPYPNLAMLKARYIKYHDCNEHDCYEPEIDRQCERGIRYLRERVPADRANPKLALVLDIDETALSNWSYEVRDGFAYIPRDFNEWVKQADAPAIPGTLHLYNVARSLGMAVFFLTGRAEAQRDETARNLRAVGYSDWTGLIMKANTGQSTIDFRSDARHKITEDGYRIILSVGDQMSDLQGRFKAELSIKLPNPFYYLP